MKRRLTSIITLVIMVITIISAGQAANALENAGFFLNIDKTGINNGEDFTVTISGEELSRLYAYEVIVRYDPEKISLKEQKARLSGNTITADRIIDNTIYHGCTKIGAEPVQNGSLDLCDLTFEAKAGGTTDIVLDTVNIVQKDEAGNLNMLTFNINKRLTVVIGEEGDPGPSPSAGPTQSPAPTSSPTPTPTATPTSAPTADPAATSSPSPAATPDVTVSRDEKQAHIGASIKAPVEDGVASYVLEEDIVNKLIEKSDEFEKSGNDYILEVSLTTETETNEFQLKLEAGILNKIAGLNHASLQINAGAVEITFDGKSLDAVSDEFGDREISIGIEKVESSLLNEEAREKVGDRPVYSFSVRSGDSHLSDFKGGTVYVSIPYVPKEDEDREAIVVYYIDNSGNLQIVMGRYNEETGRVHFTTPHFSMFAIGYNKISFVDVPADAYYYKAVTFMAARYITRGVGENRFAPMSTITRADLLVLMMNTFGIEPLENIEDNFSDAGSKYYTAYLGTAKKLGLVKGVGNNRYLPEAPISRQDMFVILYNILDKLGKLPERTGEKTLDDFSDVNLISEYAKEAMKAFVESGRIQGYNGMLNPGSISTRAEAAQVIYNLLKD